MKTVLMTAFEPFGGEVLNPSWEAVRHFEGKVIEVRALRFDSFRWCSPPVATCCRRRWTRCSPI